MIETERLVLRQFSIADVDALFPILSDPVTMSYWPKPFAYDDVHNWIARSIENYERHGFGRYAIMLKASEELIGDCGIWRLPLEGELVNDLGYIIHHPFWRDGYATEAANAVKDYVFNTLHLDALHANMPWDHHGSRRVAERIGMIKVREFVNERNRNIRTLLYVISNQVDTTA